MPATIRIPLCILALGLAACAGAPIESRSPGATFDLADVTVDAIAAARREGPGRTLLVLDIDNTLLAMEQGLGADQWYEWQKERSEADPCDPRVVADRFAVQGAVYFASAMRPTQPDAARRVGEAQAAGLPVIALTSRGVDYRLQTFRELRRNGFSFARSAVGREGGLPGEFVPPGGTRPARYEDGVFLTSGQHKGDMLEALLQLTDTPRPEVIVMADDKQSNLDAVVETFTPLGVEVRAWRYAAEDATVAAFDPDRAAGLWEELEPALRVVQELLGPDNYRLPEPGARHPRCTE